MHLFYTPDIAGSEYTLSEDESRHCIRVLRLAEGDTITLVDGKGGLYTAVIADPHPKRCLVIVTEIISAFGHRSWQLTMAVAPTKNSDRLEWFIEKATETGITAIIPVSCDNSERTVVKKERLEKVAVSAMKQSIKAYLPEISEMVSFDSFLKSSADFDGQKFIAHCREANPVHLKKLILPGKNIMILIGPEGDFSLSEIEKARNAGFIETGLGTSRLRTETAALYSCICANIMNE